jgi:Na+/citrate or Na+/malate symporter
MSTDWVEAAKVLGAIAGAAAFAWKVYDEFGNYVHISLKVEQSGGTLSALTTVENKGNRPKSIDYSFLLIGPYAESPVETGRKIANSISFGSGFVIKYSNHLKNLTVGEPKYSENGRAIIPLPFFYSEQADIGDEELSYRAILDTTQFTAGDVYSVRFFIFGKRRLHRSTHDAFVLS